MPARRTTAVAATLVLVLAALVPTSHASAQHDPATASAVSQVASGPTSATEDRAELAHRASRSAVRDQPPTPVPPKRPATRKPPAPRTVPVRHHAKPHRAPVVAPVVHASGRAAIAVAFALAQVGKPYRMGAAGPGAWDCSGLVMASWAHAGVRLPHSSRGDASVGVAVHGPYPLGAILIFPGHVAIYAGGGMMVEAPHTGLSVRVVPVRGHPAARWVG